MDELLKELENAKKQFIDDPEKVDFINRNIAYVKNLEDPNEFALLANRVPLFKESLIGGLKGSEVGKRIEGILNAQDMPKRVERDKDTGKRVATRGEILSALGSDNDHAYEIFDVGNERSWFNRGSESLKAAAKKLKMPFGDFMKALQDESIKFNREQAFDDGSISSTAVKLFLPKSRQYALENGDWSASRLALDLGENALQALPIGRVMKGLPVIGRAYRMSKAKLPKNVFENAAVPTISEVADSFVEDRPFSKDAAVAGTAVNMMTPWLVNRNIGRLGGITGAGNVIDASLKKLGTKGKSVKKIATSAAGDLTTLATNKAGKDSYSDVFGTYISGIPLVGAAYENSKSKKEADSKSKKDSEMDDLERKRARSLEEQYKVNFGVK